jgi:hypothetical protein
MTLFVYQKALMLAFTKEILLQNNLWEFHNLQYNNLIKQKN